ncbi:hypothetical protein GDO78_014903 [Eleutherodactylus coqui]|uniref:Uncharacterized protein n=1 Tax=Eleutherodactylus coqui TaxID=57060 RepID=A0A8J6EEB3_ELECQ|nr:hypothetical protein GDO78_014903 [Eleutherodactylus coqui]
MSFKQHPIQRHRSEGHMAAQNVSLRREIVQLEKPQKAFTRTGKQKKRWWKGQDSRQRREGAYMKEVHGNGRTGEGGGGVTTMGECQAVCHN